MATTYKLIAKQVLGSNTVAITFSSIPGTYDDLLVIVSGRSSRTGSTEDIALMKLNGSSSNFNTKYFFATGSGSGGAGGAFGYTGGIPANDVTANTFSVNEIYIPNYAGATNKSYLAASSRSNNDSALCSISVTAGLWSQTSAITSVELYLNTGPNFVTGSSFYLYGIKH